ncbi:MAG: hypothetical protein WCK51_03610 [Armatimonadota bacterium]
MRYFIHAPDGQQYGPADLNVINQWIAEGRIVPTTLLQPESSSMRIAASTIDGLIWAENQTFQAYTPQSVSTGRLELRASWVCLAGSLVLCCLPMGFHVVAGIAGVLFAVVAYRKGNQVALASLILNLLLLALVVFQLQGKPTPYDPQQLMDRIKALTPR